MEEITNTISAATHILKYDYVVATSSAISAIADALAPADAAAVESE